MIPFHEASYKAQVARLRSLAMAAVKRYRLRIERVDFIQHGENATFRLRGKRDYLLRIHRAGYHTHDALLEELEWLKHLGEPRPVLSRTGLLLETVFVEGLDQPRWCDILEWTIGVMIQKSVRHAHLELIGRKLASLQIDGASRRTRFRRYWMPDGILGDNAKFGSVYALMDVSRREQARITSAARELLAEFRHYEKREPRKRGLIHADLHFGNCVFRPDGDLTAIDFDDCGYGFYMYDACAPLMSVENIIRLVPSIDYSEMEAALFEGYASLKKVDSSDIEMMSLFKVARRIQVAGWLNSRASNPRLKARLRGAVERALEAIGELR